MIEIKVTEKILKEAKERNKEFFDKFGNHGTHRTNERQRMTGYLAESAIKSAYPLEYSDSWEVDFTFQDNTIDSKAQGCNSKPQGYYSATLYEEQVNRATDYYIFSRVMNDFSLVWIAGIISKKRFLNIAELKPAGTKTNNFVYDQGRYEIEYKDLKDIGDFIQWVESSKSK